MVVRMKGSHRDGPQDRSLNAVRHGMDYVDPGASSYETRYRTRCFLSVPCFRHQRWNGAHSSRIEGSRLMAQRERSDAGGYRSDATDLRHDGEPHVRRAASHAAKT